jgi:hypothetical protein
MVRLAVLAVLRRQGDEDQPIRFRIRHEFEMADVAPVDLVQSGRFVTVTDLCFAGRACPQHGEIKS